jgi:hypothetical protein
MWEASWDENVCVELFLAPALPYGGMLYVRCAASPGSVLQLSVAMYLVQGSASYAPEKSALVWHMRNFPGGKEFMLR